MRHGGAGGDKPPTKLEPISVLRGCCTATTEVWMDEGKTVLLVHFKIFVSVSCALAYCAAALEIIPGRHYDQPVDIFFPARSNWRYPYEIQCSKENPFWSCIDDHDVDVFELNGRRITHAI
jgi:hypothetical protein